MLREKHFGKERSARRVRRGERWWEREERGEWERERKMTRGCNSLVKY
jgi:hypothetical protein